MVSRSPGGSTLIAWKRRSSERSFSMYLRYSAGVVAPMQRISPRLQRRLQDVGGVERPFGRTGADQRVQLVDEDDDVRVVGQLLHDRLEALFELTAILRAGDNQRDVERENALVGEEMRHVAVDDLLRQPLDDGGLADARLADQHGVVLGAAAQHLLDPLELVIAADQRIELVLHRRLGQVAAELGQQRRFLDPGQRRLLVQQLDDVFAHRVQAHPLFHEDRRRDRALLAQDAEQQMLGADVVVQQPVGLFGRKLQHPLGFRAERESRPRSRPSRGTPSGLRFPCGCFRGRGASARRSGWSGPCPRESGPAADARSRSRCCRADWPRNGRRRGLVWPFRCTVRTSGLPR